MAPCQASGTRSQPEVVLVDECWRKGQNVDSCKASRVGGMLVVT